MSEQQSTELASHYFMVAVDNLFGYAADKKINIHINRDNPDIVSLMVAGLRITTDRDNWARIFSEFARVFSSEVFEVKVPSRTFRFDFSDTARELKVVPE